ncbi:MAG: allophanate hydrolase subunit 1 [Cytophagales bacterium]|nr:allophanate hydrolase subunit 1 [Cytophagales bacterium]
MNISQLNEKVAIAEFYPEISEVTLRKVQLLKSTLTNHAFQGLEEVWSSYHSVAISYDPKRISFREVRQNILDLPIARPEQTLYDEASIIKIPITYHHDTHDMQALSTSLGLSTQEIATMHKAPNYQVAMLGFQPGFPFLIGLPKKLHHPRKKTPSLKVPKGSVAIGGAQTGIYPSESPGGWYVIGNTTLDLFTKPDQFLLKPGDQVAFVTDE